MSTQSASSPVTDRSAWMVVGSGLVALAVAMGIGRFAFTPLMPLMMRDGTLSAAAGTEWAAANYGGYFVGAVTASWFSSNPRRGLLLSLLGVALTTLCTAEVGAGGALAGALLRAAGGLFSAWALICASSWCLAELARRQVSHLGAWIYTGVGLGIALAGTLSWIGGRQPAVWLWLELGAAAGAGALFVWMRSRGQGVSPVPVEEREATAIADTARGGNLSLALCYGVFGFGYIVPATFLPAMARALTPDPLVFGLMWPLFGLAAVLSVAAVARWLPRWSRKRLWAVAQGTLALGTALPLIAHALWAIAASAVLVGGTFMVVSMAGLQLAREERPDNPTPLLARLTAAFAAGQICGPVLIWLIGSRELASWDALGMVGAAATVLLLLTSAWLWHDAREPT
ncbi:hypothetical protein AFCDBAGC_0403 [Methylobacterium cerastii]|uniref:Major facilitator superfamily (MFS) profile domain-containing protein n=2 Tax=Methylobacterium cerastii TaxID=932741 RepID=A0ABQ4QCL9_9HYPH|nr:hypothetical protein AFCDBAGC_0403 [Methylobacterium cerastii]